MDVLDGLELVTTFLIFHKIITNNIYLCTILTQKKIAVQKKNMENLLSSLTQFSVLFFQLKKKKKITKKNKIIISFHIFYRI